MINVCKYPRRRLKWAAFIIFTVLIFECSIYYVIPWLYWPELPVLPANLVHILVVADPQLLGEQFTSDGMFGQLARWDSDRYVSKTFHFAYQYVEPDIVIFLGDNLDEGEIATDEEFLRYFARYKNVFSDVNSNKAIILPGDNDIGGENEPPSLDKEKRFDTFFKSELSTTYSFIEFVKVNYMTQSSSYTSLPSHSMQKIRIVLSHIPLTYTYSSYSYKVLSHLQPHLILSAHEHISVHLESRKNFGSSPVAETNFCEFGICNIKLSPSETHEIMVPTCSYRMGTNKMGYGVLFLAPTGELIYTVLWLPPRFLQLLFYMVLGIFTLFLLIPFPVCAYIYCCQKKNILSSEKTI